MKSGAEVSLCSRDVVPENSDLPSLAVGAVEDSVGETFSQLRKLLSILVVFFYAVFGLQPAPTPPEFSDICTS